MEPMKPMEPMEKVERIRRSIATIEDMLVCLSHYDGRPVDRVYPKLVELREAVDRFVEAYI